ncbi:MAG: N-acetylmuramoyl-L-alanine amidase [Flavobacteriales bacterium]|nr:MAG: N-acetylmuramoyl-L-alanine amidase [Flavobacteriales bacterium]
MNKRIIYCFLVLFGTLYCNDGFAQDKSDFFGVKVVCIDAGHGGKDGGCQGANSSEKEVALAIALKLGKHIEDNFPDVKVVYTRKTDVFIKLDERPKIANRAKADLFICIHANSAANKSAQGTETYVMGLGKSEANMKVAKRENSVIFYEKDYKTTYGDFDPNSPESYIMLALSQNAFLDQSLIFAAKVQKQFTERVGRRNRGVKQEVFWVLHQTYMPSVLIETGFLTNKEEEKFLTSKIGQDYMASAVFRAFKEYKNEIESKQKNGIEKQKNEHTKDVVKDVKIESKEHKKDKKRNKKNKDVFVEKGVVFKVQITTSSKKIELKPENFNGIKNVELYQAGGLYRYVVGKETNMTDANRLQLQLRAKGFKDAFIVAFSDGERISVSSALQLQH